MPSPPHLRTPSPAALATLAVVASTAVALTARRPLAVAALAVLGACLWFAMRRLEHQAATAEAHRLEAARQLDRRISELFSLQELSYVLAESIQLERIVDQVARYGARFLLADGALVALAEGDGSTLRVVAAAGTLASLENRQTTPGDSGLLQLAVERERIEVAQAADQPVALLADVMVRSAAVAPLRAQGRAVGALAVTDRREGPFTTEDLWLLSTVATQTSMAVANSRLFEMVRRSTEEWETAFEALTEGLGVVGPDGRILRANRALAALADSTADELVGADFSGVVAGHSPLARELLGAAQRLERPGPVEVRRERDGRRLRLAAAPLWGPAADGSVVILVEDVTEQRALEAQLIQNDKMASIGQLVSGVAHELNNPLTSIAGLAELLLEPAQRLPDPTRGHLRVIHDQAERAARIVRNLLTFARPSSLVKEPVDLNDVVARTAMLISHELRQRGIALEQRLDPEPVVVIGDRYELQQVLLNLLTNAVHAVATLEPAQTRGIMLATGRTGDRATLLVRDTGPGVPPALIPQLFTPFFTTKGPGQGTGLGLSVSYGLIEAHRGRISYDPRPEGGAEFRVSLPLFTTEPPTEEVPRIPGVPAAERATRVLVVDDDAAVHRLVVAIFAPQGHQVDAAHSGDEALRLMDQEAYDLVIADAHATGPDGSLFAAALLATRPDWRERLIIAGYPRASGPHPVAALHWVAKPLSVRGLRATAARILGAGEEQRPSVTS